MEEKILKLKFKKGISLIIGSLLLFAGVYADAPQVSDKGFVTLSDSYDLTDFGVWDYTSGDGDFVKYSDPFRRSVQIVCIKSENDEITDDNLCYVTSSELDGDGKYSAEFRLPPVSGKYCLIAYNPILGKKVFKFEYESKLYYDFNDAKNSGDIEVIKSFINEYGDSLGMNTIGYEMLTDDLKDSVCTYFFTVNDVSGINELEKIFADVDIEGLVIKNSDAAAICEYILKCRNKKYSGFNRYTATVFCDKLSDSERLAAAGLIAGKNADSEMFENFDTDVLKRYVKTFEYFMQMKEIVEAENNPWGFSAAGIERYRGLDDKNKVLLALYSNFEKCENLNAFRELFAASVNEQYANENKSSAEPGKPSSGGSGGGGKGTSYTLPPVKNDEIIKPGTASKTELPFKDLEGFEWAEKAIFELKERGIIDGVNNNEYRPGLNVKREEFIKMLTYGLKLTGVEAEVDYSDVKQEDWFYMPIAAAARAGLVTGLPDGSFGIGTVITRQDAAVILYRYADGKIKLNSKKTFADSDNIAEYAAEGTEKLAGAGIINGRDNNMFEPEESLSRAEAAVLLLRYFTELGVIK